MIDRNCGIYAIETPSGKRYIGSSVNLRRRWNEHRRRLRLGVHHCAGLQSAFNKYGAESLRYIVLEYASREALIAIEQRYIDAHKGSRYNATPIAGSRLGGSQSTETRAKIREFQLGRSRSPETRARMSLAQKGHAVSSATREKIGAITRGKSWAPEIVERRAAALRGITHRDNQTGFAGVGPFRNRFRARWANKHLGLFDTPEAAYAAVCAARAGLV